MSSDELKIVIEQTQKEISDLKSFINGSFFKCLLDIVNKYKKEQLIAIFKVITVVNQDFTVEQMQEGFDELKIALNNVQKVDLDSINKAGDWLKNHRLVLEFIAKHFTKGFVDDKEVPTL